MKSGLKLLTWNLLTNCDNKCCLFTKCTTKDENSGCIVERKYLDYVLAPVFKYLEQELDEYDLVELGIKYIRLHHNLVRVQKEIMASRVIIKDGKNIKINPLLAEERNLMQAIEGLDINRLLRRRVKVKVGEQLGNVMLGGRNVTTTTIEVLDESDTNYTDKLAGGGQ